MSSSQNNREAKKIKSIRRQLASRIVGQKIKISQFYNFLIFLLIMCVWFISAEYMYTGTVELMDRGHRFTAENFNEIMNNPLSESEKKDGTPYSYTERMNSCLRYEVYDKSDEAVILKMPFFGGMIRLLLIFAAILILQILIHWLSYPSERTRVKKILKPLDEIAQKADEVARLDFSEDKYRIIEDEITNIVPEDQKTVSFDDEDLIGIERAMNNLINKIHESNLQQARFVNDASHELRTPIAVIQGYANMLARWGREDEQVLDESISAIQNESDNMKRLVEQLLFLARGDAGRTVVNRERINLNTIMREVYEESLMIDEEHIYKLILPDEDVFTIGDEGLIKQAIRILVDNASKYTEEKDEIVLSVGIKDEENVFLQVQDSGIGMKAADVEHMFERFYRADEARTYNGTGLGLSIAKWIVDKHDGHFEIVSREEIGTRIGIYLGKA